MAGVVTQFYKGLGSFVGGYVCVEPDLVAWCLAIEGFEELYRYLGYPSGNYSWNILAK